MEGIKDNVSHPTQDNPTKGNRATLIWGIAPLKMVLQCKNNFWALSLGALHFLKAS